MTTKRFVENKDGVHLYSPFSDFTICGDTDDGDTARFIDIEPMRSTKKRVVTCSKCIQVILQCRGVRIKCK